MTNYSNIQATRRSVVRQLRMPPMRLGMNRSDLRDAHGAEAASSAAHAAAGAGRMNNIRLHATSPSRGSLDGVAVTVFECAAMWKSWSCIRGLGPRRVAALLCAIAVTFVLAFHVCGWRMPAGTAEASLSVAAAAEEEPSDETGSADVAAERCTLCAAPSLSVPVFPLGAELRHGIVPERPASALLSLPPEAASPPPRA